MAILYIESPRSLSFFHENKPYIIDRDHADYAAVAAVVKDPDGDVMKAIEIINTQALLKNFSNGLITIDEEDNILVAGQKVSEFIIEKIRKMRAAGENFDALGRFAYLLSLNPNASVREDLYKWLEKGNMPILEDGCFIGYKRITSDYQSFHAGRHGRLDHKLGTVVSEPREELDERRDHTCSRGLHFCSPGYLRHFYGGSGRIVTVKINPKDVVAIPHDYNLTKGRTASYYVVEEVTESDFQKFHRSSIFKGEKYDAMKADAAGYEKFVEKHHAPSLHDADYDDESERNWTDTEDDYY